MKRIKLICAVVLCAGLTAVIVGGGVFYARRNTAYRQTRIEPQRLQRLSAFTEIEGREKLRLCAHRGLSSIAPENSVEAIRLAGESGFPYALLDIAVTKDAMPVLFFDETIDRMTAGQGRVSGHTAQSLSEYPIDNGANVEKYHTLYIPSLAQALDVCAGTKTEPVLFVRSKRVAQGVLRETQGLQRAFSVLSSKKSVLELFGESANCTLWYSVSVITPEAIRYAQKKSAVLVFDATDVRNKQLVTDAVQADIRLCAMCVNSRAETQLWAQKGVQMMVTDCILPASEK